MAGFVAVGLLVLAACGSSGGSASGGADGGGTGSAASLDGTDWVLTSMTPTVPGLSAVTVSAKFSGGRISGHSGCNTYGTSFTQDGDSLTFGKDIVTTRIACPLGPSAVEQAYLAQLPKVASFARSGSTLMLQDAQGSTLLAYEKAPSGSEALTGDWSVTSFYTGNALESPVGADLTAKFTSDAVSGNGGCNTFSGGVKVDGTDITIGPLASTMMACTDTAVGTQEQQYLQALELAKTFEVLGDRLSLFRSDGGYAVVFERA